MRIFGYLNSITYEKEELDFTDEEIYGNYDIHMINRWVSMCDTYLPFVNDINMYPIPKDMHYKYLSGKIPKRKQFFNYIKKQDKDIITLKKMICRYFECNMREADDYLRRLDENQIDQILDAFSYGKNGRKIVNV